MPTSSRRYNSIRFVVHIGDDRCRKNPDLRSTPGNQAAGKSATTRPILYVTGDHPLSRRRLHSSTLYRRNSIQGPRSICRNEIAFDSSGPRGSAIPHCAVHRVARRMVRQRIADRLTAKATTSSLKRCLALASVGFCRWPIDHSRKLTMWSVKSSGRISRNRAGWSFVWRDGNYRVAEQLCNRSYRPS